MLQKIKKSYFFSDRFFSLILVFFISFSIFSCSFGVKKKVVKANPIVGVFESELAPIIVNILSSFGIVVSIPTARDYLNEEKEFQEKLQAEYQKRLDASIDNKKALAQMGIQSIKQGYYVSKEFINSVLSSWNSYCSTHNVVSHKANNYICYNFPSFYAGAGASVPSTVENISSYYNNILSSINIFVPSSIRSFQMHKNDGKDWLMNYNSSASANGDNCFVFGHNVTFSCKDMLIYLVSGSNTVEFGTVAGNITGFEFLFGSYVTKPDVNKKVIDNVLEPVNEKSQGIVISPQNVEAVGKVLNPTIPDVKGSEIESNVPISSVGSILPRVANGSDVGALPWEMGGESKPVDGVGNPPISKPVGGIDNPPISKPVDGTDNPPISKPVDGVGESIWDKILDFLKKILIPSDNFFIDEFKTLEGELNGKFNGNGLDYISDFKNNSKSVNPKFVYTFTIMGTTVTLDFSFITRIVPLCHIVFGGLTLLFLAWYHYKNVLLLIRGISPVEGGNFTGNSSGGGIDFKAMGDTAPSSPVSIGSFGSPSKGNSNYSTTNKYSGGGSK